MRYTTIIDISGSEMYKNQAVRLVYLHLVLKSGYTDADRDLVTISVRRLAMETGLTLAAVRHALGMLAKAGLLKQQGKKSSLWYVVKWLAQPTITPRAKTQRQQKAIEAEAQRQAQLEERHRQMAIEEQRRLQLEATGRTSFMVYYEDLQRRAAAGDKDAAQGLVRHKVLYEAHRKQMEEQLTQNQKRES